jgi:hypothetical protein
MYGHLSSLFLHSSKKRPVETTSAMAQMQRLHMKENEEIKDRGIDQFVVVSTI